jgi:hypothetical protein
MRVSFNHGFSQFRRSLPHDGIPRYLRFTFGAGPFGKVNPHSHWRSHIKFGFSVLFEPNISWFHAFLHFFRVHIHLLFSSNRCCIQNHKFLHQNQPKTGLVTNYLSLLDFNPASKSPLRANKKRQCCLFPILRIKPSGGSWKRNRIHDVFKVKHPRKQPL